MNKQEFIEKFNRFIKTVPDNFTFNMQLTRGETPGQSDPKMAPVFYPTGIIDIAINVNTRKDGCIPTTSSTPATPAAAKPQTPVEVA